MALVAAIAWVMMVLIIPNWYIFQATRRERKRIANITREYWRLRRRRY